MRRFILGLSTHNIHTEKIAVVRLILAMGSLITLLFNDAHLLTHLQYLYSDQAIEVMKNKLPVANISIFALLDVSTAKVICIIILVAVMSGFLPQVTSILHAWVTLSIANSIVAVDGGDQVASNLAVLLIPICLTDSRLNQWSAQKRPGNPYVNIFSNISIFFISLQAAVVYLHAGVGKLNSDDWRDGTASYYWLSHSTNGAPDWLRVIYEHLTLSNWVGALSWSVILFELLMFACLFASKKVKSIFLCLGIFFHFFIVLTHGLMSFFFSMTALLIIYLDDADSCLTIVKKIKKYLFYGTKKISRHLRQSSQVDNEYGSIRGFHRIDC